MVVFAACGSSSASGSSPAAAPPPPPPASTFEPAPQQPLPPPSASAGGGLILTRATNYRVVSGDTLSIIAANKYGKDNLFYFPLIRLANAGAVSDPDVLYVDTNLVIPDLQQNLDNAGAKALIRADMLSIAMQYDRKDRPNSAAALRNLAAKLAR